MGSSDAPSIKAAGLRAILLFGWRWCHPGADQQCVWEVVEEAALGVFVPWAPVA